MDYLVELSKNKAVKKALKTIGGPKLPPVLERADGPWSEAELDGKRVGIAGLDGGHLGAEVEASLQESGAELSGGYGQPSYPVETDFDALVLDASGVESAAELRGLFDAFKPVLSHLESNGRIVVLTGWGADSSPGVSMARYATEAFVRSLSRELGRFGTTVNLLRVVKGAESALAGPLRFLLSRRSAYITGQPLVVTKGEVPGESDWVRPLYGKVALVTGAARGIGAATAQTLAREGARVLIVDLPSAREEAMEIVRGTQGDFLGVDITDDDAPKEIASKLAEMGGVDIVVQNAGVTRDKLLYNMKPDAWDLVVGVNLEAAHRIHDHLVESGTLNSHARITFLASVAGLGGNAGQTAYTATKHGAFGLAKALSCKLASESTTVNAVAPGFIETRMTDEIPFAIREAGRRLSALSQGGLPEDVAETIAFLSMPQAAGVSGQLLRVCGGALIGS